MGLCSRVPLSFLNQYNKTDVFSAACFRQSRQSKIWLHSTPQVLPSDLRILSNNSAALPKLSAIAEPKG